MVNCRSTNPAAMNFRLAIINICYSFLVIALTITPCCTKKNESLDLQDFLKTVSEAAENNQPSTKYSFHTPCVLILAPPYASSERFSEISSVVGRDAAEDFEKLSSSKEVFWAALFERGKMVDTIEVETQKIFFPRFSIFTLNANDTIKISIDGNKSCSITLLTGVSSP